MTTKAHSHGPVAWAAFLLLVALTAALIDRRQWPWDAAPGLAYAFGMFFGYISCHFYERVKALS